MKNKNLGLTKMSRSAISLAITAVLASVPAYAAEEEDDDDKKIIITGSAIKRTDIENVLPVMIFDAESIAAQGIDTTGELISKIPAMQGYTAIGAAMNSTSGQETASLRGLGSSYTLVLLNGKRMAAHGTSNSVNISAIPIAAIDRVEILTDGASAIYGADAITGVVNFILKTDYEGTKVAVKMTKPQRDGGESQHFAITHGINGEKYNMVISYAHDSKGSLKSSQRAYGDTGIVQFGYGGEQLVFTRLSSNAAPANADLYFNGDSGLLDWRMNGYRADPQQGNGECAPFSIPQDDFSKDYRTQERCLYDFTEAVDIFPEKSVDTLLVNGSFKDGNGVELYSSLLLSHTESTTRAAASLVSGIGLDLDSAIVTQLLLNDTPGEEMLTAEQRANLDYVALRWRVESAGPRTQENVTDFINFTTGIKGEFNSIGTDWYYDTSVTYSDTKRSNNRTNGYVSDPGLRDLLNSPTLIVNPFLPIGEQSPEAIAAIAAITPNSQGYGTTDTDSLAFQGQISGAVAELPAGDVYIATGFEYREVSYVNGINQDNRDGDLLGQSPTTTYDLARSTQGMFVEVVVPVIEDLEITGAYRYDNMGGITSSYSEPPEYVPGLSSKVNDDVSETTYKISVSYRPTDELLLRASRGTGFKTASMFSIASPLDLGGSTGSNYECPFPDPNDPLNVGCDGQTQYPTASRGNPELKPELSVQKSVGVVYSPSNNFDVTIDYWQIDISDILGGVSQYQAFVVNPERYRDTFDLIYNTTQQRDILTFVDQSINIDQSHHKGVDWAFNAAIDFDIGRYKTTLRGTYMIEDEVSREPEEEGDPITYSSYIGRFNGSVTFRNKINWNNRLTIDNFSHSLNFRWKSGYHDQEWSANNSRILYADDYLREYEHPVERDVASYLTANYVTKWKQSDDLSISFGVNNLFDRNPPLSLRSSGGAGVVGYDSRYVDHLLRRYYLKASYSF